MLRSNLRSSVFALSLGAIVTGCPETQTDPADGGAACELMFLGDKAKAPELEIIVRQVDGTSKPAVDGDSVPMILPIQGGRVIFVGARVTNVDPCAATLTGVLRDLSTMQIRLDARTVNLKVDKDPAWGRSDDEDIASFSNVPVCPNQWSKTNLFGTEYELSITVTDREKRMATKAIKVVPSCAEPLNLEECSCICKGGYTLGEQCNAGSGASAPADGGM